MPQVDFNRLMGQIAQAIGDRPVDKALEAHLQEAFPPDGALFKQVEALVREGEREGWLCAREMGGIKFGRPIKPGQEAGPFSVDVVRMENVKGPHHVHPTGEIGMIMPIEGDAEFDGIKRGWYVYEAGSDHWPTVTNGSAHIVYLLPDGAIEFTGK